MPSWVKRPVGNGAAAVSHSSGSGAGISDVALGTQLLCERFDKATMPKKVLFAGDADFPSPLLEMSRHGLGGCLTLHVEGEWPLPQGIAVVGTRQPTEEAVAFTRKVVEVLVSEGYAVWSGGAVGIDAAAHTAALENGGKTVVVSPSGLNVTFPLEHKELFHRVATSGGAIVTRFDDDEQPRRHFFHRRNDVLACLTLATVIVQANLRSGSRSTARAARALGRPRLVVPHTPWDPRGNGCAEELKLGGIPLVDPKMLPALIGGVAPLEDRATRERARTDADARRALASHAHVARDLDPITSRVLDAVGEMPIHADDLCEKTQLPISSVTAALLTLTLQAVVVEAPVGRYRRSSH